MVSLLTLPEEIVHEILDYLENFAIYFSMQDVSERINTFVHDYNRYKVRSLSWFTRVELLSRKERQTPCFSSFI